MSLFPKCTFELLVPNGQIVAGAPLEGVLVLTAPEPIDRAERILLVMESAAWAGYASTSIRKVMFRAGFKFDLPKDAPFAAGEHRYPFVLDLPEWLPPAANQRDFSVTHEIEARLDVDWAVDPVVKMRPNVAIKPKHGTRHPVTVRSHPSFHEEIVVEVTLASAIVSLDEMITGEVALRNGSVAQLEWIEITLVSVAQIVMGYTERRITDLATVRIPAAGLRDGAALPFAFSPPPDMLPSFRTSFVDHDVVLRLSAQIPWRVRPSFEIPLEVLPAGSQMDGAANMSAVGGDRLRRISRAMAQQTGLIEGARRPTLAFGNVGAVKVAILDAPIKGALGVDLDFTFPDLELGILFGAQGLLEAIEAKFLPRTLANYNLRFESPDARPKINEAILAQLTHELFSSPLQVEKARLSDHHLAFHLALADDEEPRMIEVARAAVVHAKVIGDAISNLPFPMPLNSARAAWQAIATEQNAFLIPTGPAIHGIVLRAQVVGGEERSLAATLVTIWKTETPALRVVIDLRENPIPEKSWTELDGETKSDHLIAVRAVFPSIQVVGRGVGAVFDGAVWTPDPRSALSLLELFVTWVIEARGERRVDSPYR